MQERAEHRRKKITYTRVDLHSCKHNSFHTHLDDKSSWELLSKMSQEAWMEQTGTISINRVDKNQYQFISKV